MRSEARRRLSSAPRFRNLGGGPGGERTLPLSRSRVAGISRSFRECPLLSFGRIASVARSAVRSPFTRCSLLVVIAACAKPSQPVASDVDDFGDTIRLSSPPARIVSLNPTTTELIFALGAGNRLVGR